MKKRLSLLPSLAIALLSSVVLAGCAKPEPIDMCPGLPDPQGDVATMTIPLSLVAGDAPASLGAPLVAASGARYRLEMLKLYVAEVDLVKADGGREHALLLDETGAPLSYGVQLVDAEDRGSLSLSIKAPRGAYVGMELTGGVPAFCPDGTTKLNHVDASAMRAPLDVDSEMYWSWDPGYTFFKVEGRVEIDGEDKSFFYHVGDDRRLMHIALDGAFQVEAGTSAARVVLDVNRLFVTQDGRNLPRIDGSDDDRSVHDGPLADQVKENIEHSGFITLR
jgi:hypothetical protein